MVKKRVLITGASGLLGSNLAFALRERFDITGVYHSHAITIEGCRCLKADLGDIGRVRSLVHGLKPDIVIHTAALADVDRCEQNPQEARQLNVKATRHLTEALEGTAAKFVYISSDMVYDGRKSPCHEEDVPGPCNQYGLTKLEGEQAAMGFPGALALRTNFFGWSLFEEKRSLALWLMGELRLGKPVKGFNDAVFSSIYTMDLSLLLERLLQAGAQGVYNLGCCDSMTKYDFLVCVARNLGLDGARIQPVSMDSIAFRTPRSKNLALDTTKLSSIVGNVPTMEETVSHFAADHRAGIGALIRQVIQPLSVEQQ